MGLGRASAPGPTARPLWRLAARRAPPWRHGQGSAASPVLRNVPRHVLPVGDPVRVAGWNVLEWVELVEVRPRAVDAACGTAQD